MNFIESELNSPAERTGEGTPEFGVERFISFELGGQLWCVAASLVAEVVHPTVVAPLPNSPDWLLGLAAHRGEPVAVIDPRVIAKPAGENRGKAKVIVFRARPNEAQFALPIDSLREMIAAPTTPNRQQEYRHNGQPVRFIEPEQLFNSFDGGQRAGA